MVLALPPVEIRETSDGAYSAGQLAKFFRACAPGLQDRWHYLHLHKTSFGMSRLALEEIARTADLFLNVSGACLPPAPVRVLECGLTGGAISKDYLAEGRGS